MVAVPTFVGSAWLAAVTVTVVVLLNDLQTPDLVFRDFSAANPIDFGWPVCRNHLALQRGLDDFVSIHSGSFRCELPVDE